jgi:hypothetical protein
METEDSLPFLQKTTTRPCREPDESSQHAHTLSLLSSFHIIFPYIICYSTGFTTKNSVCISLYACIVNAPPILVTLIDDYNNIWWSVQRQTYCYRDFEASLSVIFCSDIHLKRRSKSKNELVEDKEQIKN